MDVLLAAALLVVTYFTGRRVELRHFKSLSAREKNLSHILVIPSEDVAYTLPVEKSRFVSAGLSLSADYFRNVLAGFVSIFGGRLHVLESVSNRARRELLLRLKEQCADALCITGVRIEVMKEKRGLVEAFAYGTALYASGPAAYRLKGRTHVSEPDRPTAPRHPLTELTLFGGGALALVIGAYIGLGALVAHYAPMVTPQQEEWLWRNVMSRSGVLDPAKQSPALRDQRDRVQALLDALPKDEAVAGYAFRVHVTDDDEINALALPGGNIVIHRGLLDALPSENALVFTLGHEMGHFAHRDHIRQLGRGFAATMLSVSLFGQDSALTRFVAGAFVTADNRFSRTQETAADEYALDVLTQHYGHAAGATQLFDVLMQRGEEPAFSSYFSTHPLSIERAEHLRQLIVEKKLEEKPAAPLTLQAPPPAAETPAPVSFDLLNYEQLASASKNLEGEYDAMFEHFQSIYAKGALDKPDFIARELANVEKAESLREQHYRYALEVLRRTRQNIDDMALAMRAAPQLAARHTDRIDQMLGLTADLAEAEHVQLAKHKEILRFLEARQGSYSLAGGNAIRFNENADNDAFNQLNRELLEAETNRNNIAEAINGLAEVAP